MNYTLWNIWLFLPKKLKMTSDSLAKDGTSCPTFPLCAGTWSVFVLSMLSQLLWIYMCSYLVVSRNHCSFVVSYPLHPALTLFLSLPLLWSQSLGKRDCNISIAFRNEHSVVSYFVCSIILIYWEFPGTSNTLEMTW